MNLPSPQCQKIQELASTKVYKGKSIVYQVKEKIRSTVQRSTKQAVKTGTAYLLNHVPVVGPELKVLFNQGTSLIEKMYKEKKATSLREAYDRGNKDTQAAVVLAELKNFSINNSMAEIDKAYQKVRHLLEKIQKITDLNECEDFIGVFQHLYVFEESKDLLFVEIEAVQKTLELLTEEVNKQHTQLLEVYENELIGLTNVYCEQHFTPCNSERCVLNSQKNEQISEKSNLLRENLE